MQVAQFQDQRPLDERNEGPDRHMVTVLYPTTREEFLWGLQQGYLVALTPAQRDAWELAQYEDLPVLSPGEVLAVAFADPNHPVQEKLDPSMELDDTWDPIDPSAPSPQRAQQYLEEEQRVDALISVRVRPDVTIDNAPPPISEAPSSEEEPAAQKAG